MNECRKIVELEGKIAAIEAKVEHLAEQIDQKIQKPLTQKAAAEYLSMTRHTLRRHTDMGLLSTIPGTTKYRLSELERYKAIHQRKI